MIYKAYDIRGVYPNELNEELAKKIAQAFALMRKKELNKEQITIVVGADMRISSPSLKQQVIEGLIQSGVRVIDIGLVSTPTFYFAVSYFGYDGGLMISASHNPAQYNGIKIVREGAKPFGQGNGMEELQKIVEDMSLREEGEAIPQSLESKGNVIVKEEMLFVQIKEEEKFVDLKKIKPMKIVVDTANAMGAQYLEELFKDLPQRELVKMNFELDGTFPAHEADPFKEENIVDLKKRVLEEKADLGISTDGDGDRIFFIDNEGDLVEPAILRGIMAELFLRDNPGSTICYDIRPGKITEDMILQNGGVPSVTRVGHSFIKKQMLETGAVFGGESSGHFFVKFPYGVFEAPMVVTLKLLQELSEKNITLADYVKPLKKYFHSGEINFKVEDKNAVLEKLKEKFADAKISNLDGLTFEYPDFWFNVRASNTESLFRLNLEGRNEKVVKEKITKVSEIIEK
ncbi:MAG: phosphomannomutase/phosphoglucomutase [Candidatus Magasanikbacteria bacterium]|nr:phosphomannomutase/phosphoglucomutase [Candidatus Magasanikbacteria bacterium]